MNRRMTRDRRRILTPSLITVTDNTGNPSMSNERPWLDHYPADVPAQIDVNEYASVAAMLEEAFGRFSGRPAFASFGRQLSYAQIDAMSRQFAGYLTGVLKLGKGDRVAIMMPNVLQYPIALFGALRAGLIVVSTNPMYTARELKHQLEDSGAKAIVVLDNFAATLQQVVAGTQVKHIVTTGLGDLLDFPKGALLNFAVKHIKKIVDGTDDPANREPFKYWDKGSMATISRFDAVAQVGKFEFGGFTAWLAWLVLHLYYLVGYRNRLVTVIAWTMTTYFFIR